MIIEHVAVIGGDRRQVELVHRLKKSVDHIWVVGFDRQTFQDDNMTACLLSEMPWEILSAILFPVSGVNRDGTVEAKYADKPVIVTHAMLAKRSSTCLIFSGIMTDFLKEMDHDIICWMERDDVAVYNSIPTAEGALMLAMENTNATIHGASVIVVGFGRCGLTIAELFRSAGANVTVVTNDDTEFARAHQARHTTATLDNMQTVLSSTDICINTIPVPVLGKDILRFTNQHCYILDIASWPGGVDIQAAKEFGLRAEEAPGLPGKVAAKTAGEILAKVTLAILQSKHGKGR